MSETRSRDDDKSVDAAASTAQSTDTIELKPATTTSTMTASESSNATTSASPEPSRKRQRTASPEPSKKTKTNGSTTHRSPEPSTALSEGEAEELALPPLPPGPPPEEAAPSDGWEAIWEDSAAAYYFYNHFTGVTTWTNPRVPDAVAQPAAPGTQPPAPGTSALSALLDPPPTANEELVRPHGGYDPSIHGSYDPTASYAIAARTPSPPPLPVDPYAATAAFNRFTGKFQAPHLNAERHNDENKTRRQMEVYFDVDAAANSHDGKSLKAERQAKRLTKKEVKAFREKTKAKKEEKRRAWLKD